MQWPDSPSNLSHIHIVEPCSGRSEICSRKSKITVQEHESKESRLRERKWERRVAEGSWRAVCAGCREISVLLFTDGVVRQALLALPLSCVPWPLPLCQPTRLVPTSPTPSLHLPTLDFSFCLFLFLNLLSVYLAQCNCSGFSDLSLNDEILWLSWYCKSSRSYGWLHF